MKVREGELAFAETMISPFYAACDALKEMHEAEDFGNRSDINQLCSELRAIDRAIGSEEVPSSSTIEVLPEERKVEENPSPKKIYQVNPRMCQYPRILPQNLNKTR